MKVFFDLSIVEIKIKSIIFQFHYLVLLRMNYRVCGSVRCIHSFSWSAIKIHISPCYFCSLFECVFEFLVLFRWNLSCSLAICISHVGFQICHKFMFSTCISKLCRLHWVETISWFTLCLWFTCLCFGNIAILCKMSIKFEQLKNLSNFIPLCCIWQIFQFVLSWNIVEAKVQAHTSQDISSCTTLNYKLP